MSRRSAEVLPLLMIVACMVAAVLALVEKASAADDETGAPASTSGPSLAIYPPQELPLRFSHEKHLAFGTLDCLDCHAGAKTSTQASDVMLPEPRLCDGCHGSDHANPSDVKAGPSSMGSCGFCHVGWKEGAGNRVARVVIPPPNLRFSHKAHADRNIGCGHCHGDVASLDLVTREHLPRMRDCLVCHDMPEPARGGAKAECVTCHLANADGTLRTRFPSGQLLPPAWLGGAEHTADFLFRHRFLAATDAQLCSSCHTEDYCTDCHDGRIRPRSFHPNDWLSMHAVAAFQDQPRCTNCHNLQSFCLLCHQRAGVVMSGPNQAGAGRGERFHPPGFADLRGRGPGHHAFEAMRNLNACVSCHTERDCAMCHATVGRRGLGVSPHGPGFTARCRSAFRRNPRPCLVCHEASGNELDACR